MGDKSNNKYNDALLIERALKSQQLGMSSTILTSDQKMEQAGLELEREVLDKKEAFLKNYHFSLGEIEKKSHNGLFSSNDDIPSIPIDKYRLDEDTNLLINDLEFWKNDRPLEMQSTLDYSDEMLLSLYSLASLYYDQKQYHDSLLIYTFLSELNPEISSFWIGMGLAFEGNEELAKAMEAFEKAIQSEPLNFLPYLGLIRCSEKLHDFNKATFWLENAKESEKFKSEAKASLEYIAHKKNEVAV